MFRKVLRHELHIVGNRAYVGHIFGGAICEYTGEVRAVETVGHHKKGDYEFSGTLRNTRNIRRQYIVVARSVVVSVVREVWKVFLGGLLCVPLEAIRAAENVELEVIVRGIVDKGAEARVGIGGIDRDKGDRRAPA